jgi:hypothetical protein
MADNFLTDKEHAALAAAIVEALNTYMHAFTTAEIKSHCSQCGQIDSHSNHQGKPWKLTIHNVWYSVEGANDQAFSLHFEGYGNQGKLKISGTFPRTAGGDHISLPSGTAHPEIRVTLSRGAETIAKEITRRFMPEYLPVLADIQKRKQSMDAYAAKQETNTKALIKAFEVTFSDQRPDLLQNAMKNGNFHVGSHRCFSGEVRVSETTADLHINSIPIATAHKIAALLMELPKQEYK